MNAWEIIVSFPIPSYCVNALLDALEGANFCYWCSIEGQQAEPHAGASGELTRSALEFVSNTWKSCEETSVFGPVICVLPPVLTF